MSEIEKTPMDKRNISARQLSVPSPRSGTDNAGAVSKFPVSYQKRDFNHGGFVSNDWTVQKKFTQPRERGNDKRLLPKGPYTGTPRGGRNSSSAKAGMSYAVENENVGFKSWKDKTRAYRGGNTRYSKEQFLQANCQFVVRESGNYDVHARNPDTLVEWDLIEQVRIFDHEVPSCPICLYPPKAAKITRCGHSYCWPCMLHYLSLGEDKYVNCPICYATVHEKDLKSVVALQTIRFEIGQEITMKLMKKSRGQTLVSPRSLWALEHDRPFSVTDLGNNSYAKLLTADRHYISDILDFERVELLLLSEEDKPDTLEGSFITAALKALEVREASLQDMDSAAVKEMSEGCHQLSLINRAPTEATGTTIGKAEKIPLTKRYASAFSDEEEEIVDEHQSSLAVTGEKEMTASSNLHSTGDDAADKSNSVASSKCEDPTLQTVPDVEKDFSSKKQQGKSDAFYFYQSADGQYIYLHGLNINCLKAQYGDLSNCPDELTAKIVDLEQIFIDEDLRKRFRCLNHLPLTCEIMMAELELKPPLVSEEVLDMFSDEIERRRQVKEQKMKYDNRRTQRIQKEEKRKMGIDPDARIVRSSFHKGIHSQSIGSFDTANGALLSEVVIGNQTVMPLVPSCPNFPVVGSEVAECESSRNSFSSEDSSVSSVPSFAQMLKMGSQKFVPVSVSKKPLKPSEEKVRLKGSDSDSEETLRAPEYQKSFMFDIEQKLAELDQIGSSEEPQTSGKKKKKMKKVLFSSASVFLNKH